MILQTDPELMEYVFNFERMQAGGFLKAIGAAALSADEGNYALMRPLLITLKDKYPQYIPADQRKPAVEEPRKNEAPRGKSAD